MMLPSIFGYTIFAVLFFILYKKRILVFSVKNYRYKKTPTTLSVTYKYLSGIQSFGFFLPKNKQVKLKYKVKLAKGDLKMSVVKFFSTEKDALFIKECSQYEEGEVVITTSSRIHYVRFEGKKAAAQCEIKVDG